MFGSLVVYFIIVIVIILLILYVIVIYVWKCNESKLVILEEKKEELYNFLVNDEVEVVKNMYLIG